MYKISNNKQVFWFVGFVYCLFQPLLVVAVQEAAGLM